MAPALSLVGVSKRFGGFYALNDVFFAVAPGEVHALLGENGAGKSTLMNVATGLYTPDAGHIEIDGKPVTLSGARHAAQCGVGMVHQHYKLVPSFSVLENLRLFNPQLSEEALIDASQAFGRQIGFDIDFDRRVGDLSVAEQQRVEILKVLVAGARIIILDEPTAVLSDEEALGLMQLMGTLAQAGKAIVLVTHKLHEALDHSARITVIRGGKKIVETVPAHTDAEQLTTDIVGEPVSATPTQSQERGDVRLRMAEVKLSDEAGRKGLDGATMIVHDGEIYGVAGVAGNGQGELARLLAGLSAPEGGSIEIIGSGDASGDTPEARREHGVATIPVDRYKHGLAGDVSVTDNFAIRGALGGKYGSWWRYRRAQARQDTRDAIETFDIQGVRSLGQRATLLSGGNAQKLVLAREFQGEPSIVVAHSPTRGLDVRAGAAVHARLRAARDRGAAVVLISEDLDEVMALSDRIAVLLNGRV
ncbi:MAG: ABC transporter ATP-binding protein, partial [Devosiaceae bacterium]|nr:ABC transporter ATP-binding protein [Devosiaceae bacterium MH13]